MPRTMDDRFFSKVYMTSDCWVWTGAKGSHGYGGFRDGDGQMRGAHRVAYRWLVGPIPEGLHLDHLCRNPACVRPDHLEPVTARVNLLRGETFNARNTKATHCPKGHPYDDENTYRRPGGAGRGCRACQRESNRRYHATPEYLARRREEYHAKKVSA